MDLTAGSAFFREIRKNLDITPFYWTFADFVVPLHKANANEEKIEDSKIMGKSRLIPKNAQNPQTAERERLKQRSLVFSRLLVDIWKKYYNDKNFLTIRNMIGAIIMKIETERLFLREMNETDYEALYSVLADSDIMQHYPYSFDERRVRGWIEKNIERYRVFGFGLWAVCLKENKKMIGDCGLTMQNINGMICPEIGYHIRRDCQRKGFAREAASAVRDWAFDNTPFNVLYSYMKAENIASAATAKSIGMRKVSEYIDGEQVLTSVYSLER